MTFPETLQYQFHQLRRPWFWACAGAFGLPVAMSYMANHWRQISAMPGGWLLGLGWGLLEAAIMMWFPAMAWLWSGRSGEYPALRRSVLQGALLCLVLTLARDYLEVWVDLLLRHIPIGSVTITPWILAKPLLYIPVFVLFGYFMVSRDRALEAQDEAVRRIREAQWILLKGQMNPHVFFNAMNNLAELVREASPAARHAVMDLKELFRSLLEHGNRTIAPLGDERRLVEHYLAVEGLRLGGRLQVHWDWDPALDALPAPPLLVQPLVENAIKHGLSPSRGGGRLEIRGIREGTTAVLSVGNTGRPLVERESRGLGLKNLKARLELAFGPEASFRLHREGEWTLTELRIPVASAPGRQGTSS